MFSLHHSFSLGSFSLAICCCSTYIVFTGKFDNGHVHTEQLFGYISALIHVADIKTNCIRFLGSPFFLHSHFKSSLVIAHSFSKSNVRALQICYSIQSYPKHMHGHAPNKVHRNCYDERAVVVLFVCTFFSAGVLFCKFVCGELNQKKTKTAEPAVCAAILQLLLNSICLQRDE